MEEELGDAEKYAKLALKYAEEYKDLADVFHDLSLEEMKHMQALHDETVDIIADYRKKQGEPPAPMMAVYEYLHEKNIEKAGEVKSLQQMYKD